MHRFRRTPRVLGRLVALVLVAGFAFAHPAMADDSQRLLIKTSVGDLVVALNWDQAPNTAAQFEKLATLKVFDGTHIVRIEPGFVAQTSEATDRLLPLLPEQSAAIVPLALESSPQSPHVRGALSLARPDDDRDGGLTSFSFLLGDAPHLDGGYTVFGNVESGLDVLDAFVAVPLTGTAPTERLEILSVEVISADDAVAKQESGLIGRIDTSTNATSSDGGGKAPTPARGTDYSFAVMCVLGALGLVGIAGLWRRDRDRDADQLLTAEGSGRGELPDENSAAVTSAREG